MKYFHEAPLFWKMEGSKRNNVDWTVQSWNTEHQFPWTCPVRQKEYEISFVWQLCFKNVVSTPPTTFALSRTCMILCKSGYTSHFCWDWRSDRGNSGIFGDLGSSRSSGDVGAETFPLESASLTSSSSILWQKKTYIKQRKQSVNPTMHCCKVSTWMKTPAWLCQLHHPLLLRWRRWWKRHWTCLRWQSHAARDALETHARVRRASAGRKWCRSPAATPRSSP